MFFDVFPQRVTLLETLRPSFVFYYILPSYHTLTVLSLIIPRLRLDEITLRNYTR